MSESRPRQETADCDSLSGTKKERFECPTCGETFVEYPSQNPKYCSRDCLFDGRDYKGENNPNYSGGDVTLVCEWCGSDYGTNPANADKSRFCSQDCRDEWRAENLKGEDHPSWKGGNVQTDCAVCGDSIEVKPYRYEKYENNHCSQECRAISHAERFSGEDHPNWNPQSTGEGFYQTTKWREARLEALKRDQFTCHGCGEWDTKLHVHHIVPVADGGSRFDLDNLITFCMSCHNRWEGLYLRPDTRHVEG